MPAEAQCANPLLLSFLKKWWDEAKDRNTKGVIAYKRAYQSMLKCPMKLSHPSEATLLENIGAGLAKRMTEALEQHCEENGLPKPKKPRVKRKLDDDENEGGGQKEGDDTDSPKKKQRKLKPYVPKLRSGAYAIIIALSNLREDSTGLTKDPLIERAQPYCDASFKVAQDVGKFYKAWDSMKTLEDKQLVHKKGRPGKYTLTEAGWEMATRMKKTADPDQGNLDNFVSAPKSAGNIDGGDDGDDDGGEGASGKDPLPLEGPDISDLIPQGSRVTDSTKLPQFEPVILEPGSFTVELVVDTREIMGKKHRSYMEKNLTAKGVTPLMRALTLGDISWVAKTKVPGFLTRKGFLGDEIMLDYIVERKRLDDLVSSIKDGRFQEQKFRLKKSGVKNVMYIVEEITNSSDEISKYAEAMKTAIASCQVTDGFFVKRTQKMDDTISYLIGLTKMLKERYESKPLHVIPCPVITANNYRPLLKHLEEAEPGTEYHVTYEAFSSLASKSETLTVRDVYLKMLMCTRGLTGEKAIELQKKWTTPKELIEAYHKIEEKYGNTELGKNYKWAMVSGVMADNPVPRKKVQKALSTKIAEVWGGASTAMA